MIKTASPAAIDGSDMARLPSTHLALERDEEECSEEPPKEREMYKAGEYLFSAHGQNDCMHKLPCEGGKRIRLQNLGHMTTEEDAGVVGSWPATRGHGVVRRFNGGYPSSGRASAETRVRIDVVQCMTTIFTAGEGRGDSRPRIQARAETLCEKLSERACSE